VPHAARIAELRPIGRERRGGDRQKQRSGEYRDIMRGRLGGDSCRGSVLKPVATKERRRAQSGPGLGKLDGGKKRSGLPAWKFQGLRGIQSTLDNAHG